MVAIVTLAELHLPGSTAGFPAGSEIELPEAQAAELVAAGVARLASPAAAAAEEHDNHEG